MTAPALPPEVERALVAAIDAVDDAANGHITNAQSCAAEDALRTAIARALGGDGEPVAWGLTDGKAGQVLEPLFTNVSAAEAAARRTGFLTVVPIYTRPAATGDTGEGDCPHHSETGLGGCGRFAWHCDGCGRIRWIYDASKGIGSRADVPRGVVLEGPPTTAVEIARRMLTLGDVALLLERAGSSDDEQGSARRTLLRLEALRNALAAEATRAATGDHPSEARRGHESEGLGGPDAR